MGCCLGTGLSSHSLSLLRSEAGESLVICMSSTSTPCAAFCSAVGIMDQIPRTKLQKKMKLRITLEGDRM